MENSSHFKNTVISRNIQDLNPRIAFNERLTHCSNMDGETFERAVIDTLASIIENKNMRHDPTATQAWPYKKAPGRAWQAMRTTGKAQKMTLRDAFAMASFLGIPMSQLCALVESRELQGDTFRATPPKNAPGRPSKEREMAAKAQGPAASSVALVDVANDHIEKR